MFPSVMNDELKVVSGHVEAELTEVLSLENGYK